MNKNPETIYTGVKNDRVGPGQYNVNEGFKGKNKGPTWHKSKVSRLAPTVSKEKELMVGPGTYDVDSRMIPLHKLRPSVVFQSKS